MNDTTNTIYNILFNDNYKTVGIYILLIIIIMFISNNINYNINIIIGVLIIGFIIYNVNYYTMHEQQTDKEIKKDKFDSLYTRNDIIKDQPKIVDILFYMQDYKKYSLLKFKNLIEQFEKFIKLYTDCQKDYTLVFDNYEILVDIKLTILVIINSFVFSINSTILENKLIKIRETTELVLNEYLNNLVIINKKMIYYNGYNINTKPIDTTNVIAFNTFNDNNISNGNLQIQDLQMA